MPLTLRPTRLSRDPDPRNNWSIHEDGEEIGRLYEDLTAPRREIRWFWSIIVMGSARRKVRTDGRAPTFEEAKAQFAANWEAFKRAREAEEHWGDVGGDELRATAQSRSLVHGKSTLISYTPPGSQPGGFSLG